MGDVIGGSGGFPVFGAVFEFRDDVRWEPLSVLDELWVQVGWMLNEFDLESDVGLVEACGFVARLGGVEGGLVEPAVTDYYGKPVFRVWLGGGVGDAFFSPIFGDLSRFDLVVRCSPV